MRRTCTQDEVQTFLRSMKIKLSCPDGLVIVKEHKRGDKTNNFMILKGLTRASIIEELMKLDILNYSYTDYDNHPWFKDEEVWIFGQMYDGVEVYIKLKLREKVVCLSFHEKEYNLKYPYLNG